MNSSPEIKHYIYLGILSIFWGIAFLFAKVAVEGFTPITLTATRVTIGAIIVGLITLKIGGKFPSDIKNWILCAFIGITGIIAPFSLLNWGLQYANSNVAAIFMALVPIMTLILAHIFTHDEKFTWPKLAGIICGLAGILVLFSDSAAITTDCYLLYFVLGSFLATAMGYATAGILIRKLETPDPLGTSAAILFISSILVWPIAFIFEQPWMLNPEASHYYSVLVLGVFSTGIATVMLVQLTNMVGASFVSYNTYIVPVIAMLAGYIWLNEPLKQTAILAIFLILFGIYLTQMLRSRSEIDT